MAENSRKKVFFQLGSIAIIAILAGMLLPALNKARDKAKAIGCVNNMKQNGTYLSMYSSNNSDYYLPYSGLVQAVADGVFGTASKRYNFLRTEGSNNSTRVEEMTVLTFLCPGTQIHATILAGSSTPLDYCYHEAVGSGGSDNLAKAGISRQPSKTAFMVEGWNWGVNYKQRANMHKWGSISENRMFDIGKYAAHSGGATQLFEDGHVATLNFVYVRGTSGYIWKTTWGDLVEHTGF